MKLICTTSDAYGHILPIFIHLFKKYWNKDQQVEIVGYQKPEIDLPNNFLFYSRGIQTGNKKDFSNSLIEYFKQQDEYFIWGMEDTFLKAPVNLERIEMLMRLTRGDQKIGRVELTGENQQHHTNLYAEVDGVKVWETPSKCDYRLSTQMAIWNKDYLLRYLTSNLSPWDFECQPKIEDEFHNIGLTREDAPVTHNEGVRRFNLFEYNFAGIDPLVIKEMEDLGIIPKNNVNWNPPADKIKAYLEICKRAAEDDTVFENFKRNPAYNYVLEHTNAKLGEEYLKQGIFEREGAFKNDDYGNPVKRQMGEYICSPTTIQYMSIACKIVNEKLHTASGTRVVEIGGGYGGQCVILNDLIKVLSYDIIDLPEVNLLQNKYLKKFKAVFDTYNSDNYPKNKEYDLCISNYALSEVQEPLQTEYVKNVCLNSKHGYITSNGKIHAMNLIKERFPDTFKISSDIDGEVDTNFILTW